MSERRRRMPGPSMVDIRTAVPVLTPVTTAPVSLESGRAAAAPQMDAAERFFASERGETLGAYIHHLLFRIYKEAGRGEAILMRAYGPSGIDSEGRMTVPDKAISAIQNEVYRLLTSTAGPDVKMRERLGLVVSGSGDRMSVEFDTRRLRDPLARYIIQFAPDDERRRQPPLNRNVGTMAPPVE